jgi:hypothetical protein
MFKPLPFDTLRDVAGQVTVGWAGDSVVHSRMDGALSADLGRRFAAHVQRMVEGCSQVHYFSDGSCVTSYDLLARSAFVRMALAKRRHFASFTFLLWPVGVTEATRAFATALGEGTQLCVEAEDFERRLMRVAPLAKHRLEPTTRARAEAPTRSPR